MSTSANEVKRILDVQLDYVPWRFPRPVRDCFWRFDNGKSCVFDFAWPAYRVAVMAGDNLDRWCNEAVIAGWMVLWITSDLLADEQALDLIGAALARSEGMDDADSV